MNANLPDHDPTIEYYDSDYPSRDGVYPENFDETTEYQGVAHDVERYLAIARGTGGPILELCCGTGRIALPLARAGFDVTAVDVSAGMLDRLREKLTPEDAARVTLVHQDVTRLDLARRDFAIAIIGFNSLPCIPDFALQRRALEATARHLAPRGLFVIDAVNPLALPVHGDPVPKPFFTRRNVHTGHVYTRFAMMGEMDADQRQRLHGWYDETAPDGTVKRRPYSLFWRPIARFELQLMLEGAGFVIDALEGGHRGEPFTARSPRMLVQARRTG
jgi:ubiquinone/menaquinone biosynthesis C-methylase UbiE